MPTRTVLSVLEKTAPVIVEPDKSVFETVKSMVENGESAALIVENGKTIGIITEHDLIKRILLMERDAKTTPVEKIMTSDTVVIRPERLFGQALYLMHEYDINHIPVVDEGKPIGIVSKSHALDTDIEDYALNAEFLDHITEIL